MLCHQGLGNSDMAARERKLYERFKADESAQAITGPYRQLHPDDNNERQSIHEHHSVPPGGTPRPGVKPPDYPRPRATTTTTAAAAAGAANPGAGSAPSSSSSSSQPQPQ